MNVVVSWDAIADNIHKTYIVHHWSNERSLLVPQTSIPKPENEEQMVLTVTNTADNVRLSNTIVESALYADVTLFNFRGFSTIYQKH